MPYHRDPDDPSMLIYDGPMIDPELARTRGRPFAEVAADMSAHGFGIENGQWHSDEDPSSPNAQAMIAKYDFSGKYDDYGPEDYDADEEEPAWGSGYAGWR